MGIVEEETKTEIFEEEINPFEVKKEYHDPNGYKIRCGYWYPLYRTEFGGRIFYKIMVSKKDINGTTLNLYKQVTFFKNKERVENIKDGVLIKPLKIQEDGYYNKNDKYNVIWTLRIFDWEIRENEEQQYNDAIKDYKQQLNVNEIEYNDDDLPF